MNSTKAKPKYTPKDEYLYRLTDLHISFVSACRQGANQGAKIMLKKEHRDMAENENVQTSTEIKVDLTGLSEEITKSLSEVLNPLIKKEDVNPDVIVDSVQAVVASSIEKMGMTINSEIKDRVDSYLKEYVEANKPVEKQEEIVEINGQIFKKSVMGDEAFKAISEINKSNLALRKELEQREMINRVEKEYPNITGSSVSKAALLNVINHAEKDAREMGLAVLKALNEMSGEFAKELGENGIQKTTENYFRAVTDTDASIKLDQMAQELASKEGITKAQAYLKVCSTPEGEALYNKHISNK